jgi:hypothetical protein
MALPAKDFTPDIGILHHLPVDKEAARIYRALVGVIVEGDVYRTARPGVWQLETFMAPHIVRRAIERAGMDVLSIEPDDAAPGCVYYVRFAPEPYCGDNDWPAAPYQGVNPWHIIDWPRAPKAPRTDAVAGPGGVVLCNLETTPAALIPVPGAPGLDYSYADMGMVPAAPVVEPTPPEPGLVAFAPKPYDGTALARHIANATARQVLVGPDRGCTAAFNRLPLTRTISGDLFEYQAAKGKAA